jgi:hypothetical protein
MMGNAGDFDSAAIYQEVVGRCIPQTILLLKKEGSCGALPSRCYLVWCISVLRYA